LVTPFIGTEKSLGSAILLMGGYIFEQSGFRTAKFCVLALYFERVVDFVLHVLVDFVQGAIFFSFLAIVGAKFPLDAVIAKVSDTVFTLRRLVKDFLAHSAEIAY
jgi:hypothetical protein